MADKPTGQSVIEGTVAQVLGGSLASTIILTMASFHHYVAAGLESALGTLFSVICYLGWKGLRMRGPSED